MRKMLGYEQRTYDDTPTGIRTRRRLGQPMLVWLRVFNPDFLRLARRRRPRYPVLGVHAAVMRRGQRQQTARGITPRGDAKSRVVVLQ